MLAATRPHPKSSSERVVPGNGDDIIGASRSHPPSTMVPDGIAPAFLHRLSVPIPSFLEQKSSSCQKLLFSATLTRDPGKISALELKDPKYFIVQGGGEKESADSTVLDVVMEKFSMPSTLKVCLIPSQTSFSLTLTCCEGAYDCICVDTKTARLLPPCSSVQRDKCPGLHQVCRIDDETCSFVRLL